MSIEKPQTIVKNDAQDPDLYKNDAFDDDDDDPIPISDLQNDPFDDPIPTATGQKPPKTVQIPNSDSDEYESSSQSDLEDGEIRIPKRKKIN